MKRYISDLHLFHNKILELTERPYCYVQQMHGDIFHHWKRTVSEADTVYILGDVGMYHEKDIARFLNSLPGEKILITGNHDMYNLRDEHFRSVFSDIKPYLEVLDKGRKVVLFHYPIEEWNGYFRGFYHLYGHVHNKDVPKKPHRYNVCLDAIGPAPLTLDEIIAKNEVQGVSISNAVLDVSGAISIGCNRCMYPVNINCDNKTFFTGVMCVDDMLYVVQNADGSIMYDADGKSIENVAGVSEEDIIHAVQEFRKVK